MVKVSTVRMEPKNFGLIYKMIGIPERVNDGAFDSELFLSPDPNQNHVLQLTLNILLNPRMTKTLDGDTAKDADGDVYKIRPWDGQSWDAFKRLYREQARTWTNHFWLTPPDTYNGLDVGMGDARRRPNVYCDLEINLVGSVAVAHRTIEVVNLDRKGLGDDATSGTFRSHERLYDSLDESERENAYYDDAQQIQKHAHYLTIPHEVGHALGLPHIGVTHQDPQCMVAILLKKNKTKKRFIPAMYRGGSNSRMCYGEGQSAERSGNIMGGGTAFEESNAKPWVDRIALHTRTDPKDWTVSLKNIQPWTI